MPGHLPVMTANKTKSKVKIIGRDTAGLKIGADVSDAAFGITVLRLEYPNGGESLGSGGHALIVWHSNITARPVAQVKLLYTLDGGSTWKSITTLSSNPASYDWTLPVVTASKPNCKVRVILKDSAGAGLGKDDSDTKFTLHP